MRITTLIARFVLVCFCVWGVACTPALCQINLQPKYGGVEKSELEKAADQTFLAAVDKAYPGDRKGAAKYIAKRGWEFLHNKKPDEAMRRFNQAWLVNPDEGLALWGMAAIQIDKEEVDQGLQLFGEAALSQGSDIDFAADRARAMGMVAVLRSDEQLLNQAWKEYETIYRRAPENVLNLQNWAISYFFTGRYAEAWEKIKLAEKAPRASALDPQFLKDLAAKMPRPGP